jgi:hypothetical protein
MVVRPNTTRGRCLYKTRLGYRQAQRKDHVRAEAGDAVYNQGQRPQKKPTLPIPSLVLEIQSLELWQSKSLLLSHATCGSHNKDYDLPMKMWVLNDSWRFLPMEVAYKGQELEGIRLSKRAQKGIAFVSRER